MVVSVNLLLLSALCDIKLEKQLGVRLARAKTKSRKKKKRRRRKRNRDELELVLTMLLFFSLPK